MTIVSIPATQQAATTTQPIRHNWDSAATHATIDSTCDKVGTFMIDAGNLVGGPVAAALSNQTIDCSKNLISSKLPIASPLANTILDLVKVPLSVASQRSGPAIAEACVMTVMPVSRTMAHGSANVAEKSANWSKKLCK